MCKKYIEELNSLIAIDFLALMLKLILTAIKKKSIDKGIFKIILTSKFTIDFKSNRYTNTLKTEINAKINSEILNDDFSPLAEIKYHIPINGTAFIIKLLLHEKTT